MPGLQPRPHTQLLQLRLERLRPNSQPSTLSLGEQAGGCPANPRGEWGVQVSQNMPRRVLPRPGFCVQLRVWLFAQLLENSRDQGEAVPSLGEEGFQFPCPLLPQASPPPAHPLGGQKNKYEYKLPPEFLSYQLINQLNCQ